MSSEANPVENNTATTDADRGPFAIVELAVEDPADETYNADGDLLALTLPVRGAFNNERIAEEQAGPNEEVIEVFGNDLDLGLDDAETTPIYAHKANDEMPHCSYDVDFPVVDDLTNPHNAVSSTLEWVEMQFYSQEWADDLIESLPTEGEREEDPVRIGTLTYMDRAVADIEFEKPDDME